MTRRLTLSFDNGPTPGVTELVLDELARRALLATFFMIGEKLMKPGARALAERAVREGHWVGNHTMHHEIPFGAAAEEGYAAREIEDAQAVLGELAGPRKLFRPYAGGGRLGPHVLSRAAIDHLSAHHHTLVTWNSVPHDWEPPFDAWVARSLDDVARQDWTLVVLHDIQPQLPRTLPRFLDAVADDGVEMVQEFPPDCVLMEQGAVLRDFSGLVAS